jgi:multicomponent Na+:H+ antiporter subunit D
VIIVASTLLNAAYFLPIIYTAFFEREPAAHAVGADAAHDHGEAPLPIVIALTFTAAATVGLFLFPDVALSLAKLMVGG